MYLPITLVGYRHMTETLNKGRHPLLGSDAVIALLRRQTSESLIRNE
jgi:hypothetical protein